MAHIGRGEQVGVVTFFDALAHQTGGAELGGDGCAGSRIIARADFGHDVSEAARAENAQLLGCGPTIQWRQAKYCHQN
jgi:hypothetical protein